MAVKIALGLTVKITWYRDDTVKDSGMLDSTIFSYGHLKERLTNSKVPPDFD